MESTTPPPAPATGPSPETPGLQPLPKNPFQQKWWQLPRTVYITIAAVAILSLSSTAFLFFAPAGIFSPKSEEGTTAQDTSLETMYSPKNTPTPEPSGIILVDGPTATPPFDGSPTPTPDVTVSWLTFKNFAYGYSFKYPADWTVTDTGNLEPSVPSYLTINPSNTATPASALNITISASTRTFDQEVALRSSTKTALTINGLQASLTEERNSSGAMWTAVVVKGTSYTYILVGKSSYYSIFTPFYSTFKLL